MNGRDLSREEFRYRAALDLCRRAAAANADPAVARTVAKGYVDQLAALLCAPQFTPDELAEVFEWLARVAAMGGGVASVNASRARAYIQQMETGWHAMRAERDQARARAEDCDRRIHQLAASVQAALDTADPDQPGALADFMHAINELPAVAAARDEQLGRLPIVPSPRRRTP